MFSVKGVHEALRIQFKKKSTTDIPTRAIFD
jgi:hypothetical protein